MSEIIKLKEGSYEYKIPSPPSREEDILFITEKKKDQYWRTPPLPDFRRMNIREKVKYIDTDRDRWVNGVHIMINGELTYINGIHWNHLVHMTFGGKKAYYLDHQRLDFYFRQLSWEAPKCKCRVTAKGRRVGASMEETSEADYRLCEDFNRHVALVSIEERKTKETLFNPIVDSYVKKLKHMRANFYKPNGKKPKQKLLLALDDLDEDSEFQQDTDRLDLGGWLIPFPTSVSALDAYLIHYASVDEIFKWTACNPEEFLKTSLPCFDDGGVKLGLPSLLSTLGDSDDMQQAVEAGIKIYSESDVRDLLPNGYTKSGCWSWFISSVFSFRSLRNKYGKINIEKATEEILNERSKYEEGSQEWIHEVRRHPLTEEEAMATATGSTTFDNIRLNARIKKLEKMPIKERPYTIGNFHEYTDNNKKSKIVFEPTNNGIWQVAIQPYKNRIHGIDRSNRCWQDEDGKWHLNNSPEGAGGYDPVRYGDKQSSSNNLSKSAIILRYKFDYFGNKDKFGRSCAGRYAALLHMRDDDPALTHFEFCKALRFYGFKGTFERNVGGVYDDFVIWQALELLETYGGIYGLFTDGQKRVIKKGIDKFQALIKRPKAGEIDRLEDIPFDILCSQAKELDPLHTQKSDVFMANTMLDHGLEKIIYTDEIDEMMEATGPDHTLLTLF